MPKRKNPKIRKTKQTAMGVVSGDPLENLSHEVNLIVHAAQFWSKDLTHKSQGLGDWDQFKGSLLALGLVSATQTRIVGSAACIAPGLAVTASHVFRDSLDGVMLGAETLMAMGPRNGELDLWQVTKITHTPGDDISFIHIKLQSKIGRNWQFTTFKIRKSAPKVGEHLSIFGFRFPGIFPSGKPGIRGKIMHGELLATRGLVEAFYPISRDSTFMNFPCIQIGCESLGGVSGGAVLDDAGLLIGILSSSYETENASGPSMASWLLPTMDREVDLDWPPTFYGGVTRVVDLRTDMLHLVD